MYVYCMRSLSFHRQNEVPRQCRDFTDKHFPADLRASGLPFGYPNTGAIIGPARIWSDVFFPCYHAKVEATHRGEKVPCESRVDRLLWDLTLDRSPRLCVPASLDSKLSLSLHPTRTSYADYIFKNSDQKFFYYILMGCPLDAKIRAQIKLDYYQDLFGSIASGFWDHYSWDEREAVWSLSADALGTSPRALEKAKAGPVERAPILLHLPGKGKLNYWGWNRMTTTLLQGYQSEAVSPLHAFRCSTLQIVEFREAFMGELCPTAPSG